MNQKWTKLIALFLVMLMLFSVVSCVALGGGNETSESESEETPTEMTDEETEIETETETETETEVETGTGTETSAETDTDTGTETGAETDTDAGTETGSDTGKPVDPTTLGKVSDIKINDEISILTWSDAEHAEFCIEEIVGDAVSDEIYWRNRFVEDQLGITLKWSGTAGNENNKTQFSSHVQASYLANDRAYDIIASHSRTMALVSSKGFLADLNAIENNYIDLSKAWWPASLSDNLAICDSLYFVTGDISTNMLYHMSGVYCNLTLCSELNLEDPIQLVLNGEWTLSKLMEMCGGLYKDADADGTKGLGDTWGFLADQGRLYQFYVGSDLAVTERDETSKLVLSPDYTSEKLHSLVDMLSAFISSPDVQGVSGSSVRVFAEGNVLFTHNYLYYAEQQLNAVPFSYTILPTPKYDGEQDTYYTQVGAAMTLWGIMNDSSVEDKSNFSAVLEVLAYNAYNYTTEMVFQEVYKDVFSETRDNTKMFEYIRNGIRIDRVEVLATVLFNDDVFCTNFNNAVWNGEKWSSVLSVFERVLKNYIKRVVQTYEQLEG